MANFYYREIEDPENPGKMKKDFIPDDTMEQDDLIYAIPGGIENYEKCRQIVELAGQMRKDSFLDNQTEVHGEFTFIPKPEKSQYDDPELARIELRNKPLQIEAQPNDPKAFFANHNFVRVVGQHRPEPVLFHKMVDYSRLPKMPVMDTEHMDLYRKVLDGLPSLFQGQVKRGMRIKITGDHMRLRPLKDGSEGFFLLGSDGARLDLTDFLEVNSNSLLLWLVPLDIPVGHFRFEIVTAWYGDNTIKREGKSPAFEIV